MAKLDENVTILTKEEIDNEVLKIQQKIDELRADGYTKVKQLQEEIATINHEKTLSKETKAENIALLKEKLAEAKKVRDANKEEIKKLVKEAKTFLNPNFKNYYTKLKNEGKVKKTDIKSDYLNKLKELKVENANQIAELKSTITDKKELSAKLKNHERSFKANLYELKINYKKGLDTVNDEIHSAYRHNVHLLQNLNGEDLNIVEKVQASFESYCYKFTAKDFFLKNGLYIVMIIAFIVCCIAAGPMGKGNLIAPENILGILEQSSPRIFLALGVAGLILLAGTDLSIGRMVGLGSIITCMILHPGPNTAKLFGVVGIDFTALPDWFRIILALVLTILLCTLFSAIAGYFTAKFKMHPFISTLSTQLMIFGFVAVITDSMNTGVIDLGIKKQIAGDILGIPALIIYAIIGIAIVSFIWNKTKFGKNMYAVGGNQEAAAVSGINVFWVTLSVFIMAGILYGFGSFFESVRLGTGKFDTGTGYELDAIAACVVGGISFSGGIGKLRGAVIGAIIFTALTYALTFLGINPYYQFIIKGLIILVAVTIDSIKYLKKK